MRGEIDRECGSSIFRRDGETSVRLGTIFGGIGDAFLHPPLNEGGRVNWIGETTFPSFFSFFANKLFMSFLSLPRKGSNNLTLVRKTSAALSVPFYNDLVCAEKNLASLMHSSSSNRPIWI